MLTDEQRKKIQAAKLRKLDAPEAYESFREVSSALGGVPLDFDEPEPSEGKKLAEKQAAQMLREKFAEQIKPTKDGKNVPGTLANALVFFRYDPEWHGVLAFNEFTQRTVTKKSTPWGKPVGENWTDNDDRLALAWLQEHGCRLGSSQNAGEAVETVALENGFHPVKDYFQSLKWDGRPRLDTWLIEYAGAEDTAINRAFASRWMISAVARVMTPGCQVDSYLQLESPQGTGKSTLLRTLAGTEWFTDNISEMGTKDSRLELQGKLIIEIAELDRIKGRDNSRVKAFISARYDIYRPHYGRRTASFPRSCVFASTTNDYTSLTDESGARRTWPVRVGRIDIAAVQKNRDQLWAEAYVRYRKAESWYLNTRELLADAKRQQDLRYVPGPWDALIEEWLEDPAPKAISGAKLYSQRGRILVREALEHAIGKPKENWTQPDLNAIVRCLVHNGYQVWQSGSGETRGLRFYVRDEP